VITKQNVEAREAILELNKQLAEKEEKQKREIASIKAREEAETEKVTQEERLKSERARIQTEEELQVAEQNKLRQIVVAQKSKEKTEAVENERVNANRCSKPTNGNASWNWPALKRKGAGRRTQEHPGSDP
jgi:uncharacterized membrane protein YqiK